MGGKTANTTSTNNTEPPAFQKPFIESGLKRAEELYKSPGPSYFPGSTVAGFSPEQTESFGAGAQHARGAAGFNTDMMSGKYLQDPNNDAVFDNIRSRVMPAVNSQFMGAGRTGSGLHADTLGRSMTEAYAPYASAQYQTGLDRMTDAANNYTPYSTLEGIGQQRQGLAQNELQDAINRFDFGQELPGNKLSEYMGFVGGNFGGNTTSTTPYQKPSIWSQLGGGMLSAGGLAGTLGWKPFG